ncbi:MAG: DUF6597 domain-containing transcriptional factor [Flavipsychrobacter sp.]
MRLTPVHIPSSLRPYIEKMWVFESEGRAPSDDMKLVVPNGRLKLVVPYRNGLLGSMEGWQHLSKENKVTLIGMCDQPSVVDVEHDAPSGTIGIEFMPLGAYRFFGLNHKDIRNTIYNFEDIFGKVAAELEERIADSNDVLGKVRLLQQFLIQQLNRSDEDAIIDYCLNRVHNTNGAIPVKQLEKETGYSSRWLNMKFEQRVGISPKQLSAISRFQYCYNAIVSSSATSLQQLDFYNLYFDQAHFIKEFKRFAGVSPLRFMKSKNDFGRIFYKD